MNMVSLSRGIGRRLFLPAALAVAFVAAACDNNNGGTAPNPEPTYNQVQRLGNPLVSEVFLAKRDHGFHGATAPTIDVASFGPIIRAFTSTVAGRQPVVGNTLVAVLLPDELIVHSDKNPANAGWLTWALDPTNGWGGRKLDDDVVTAGLQAIFGPLLDPNNTTPGLSDDNVNANDVAFGTTFPYLAAAH